MVKYNAVYQLIAINEVLSQISSFNSEKAEHARRALLYYKSLNKNNKLNVDEDQTLSKGIRHLVELHFGYKKGGELGVQHLHIPSIEVADYLWIKSKLNKISLKLSGFDNAIFLATGLKKAIKHNNIYWTRKHQIIYDEFKDWMEYFFIKKSNNSKAMYLLII